MGENLTLKEIELIAKSRAQNSTYSSWGAIALLGFVGLLVFIGLFIGYGATKLEGKIDGYSIVLMIFIALSTVLTLVSFAENDSLIDKEKQRLMEYFKTNGKFPD